MLKGQAYDDVNAAIGTIDSSNMSSRHGAIMPYGRLSGITASFVLSPPGMTGQPCMCIGRVGRYGVRDYP
jgi:hypothetical protein